MPNIATAYPQPKMRGSFPHHILPPRPTQHIPITPYNPIPIKSPIPSPSGGGIGWGRTPHPQLMPPPLANPETSPLQ